MNGKRLPRLIHVGNVVMDIVVNVRDLPPKGADIIASGSLVTPGGGFNVMVSAARQGLPAIYGGVLGSGPFGSLTAKGLAEAGITMISPPESQADTGFVVCLIDDSGERTFVTAPGAEATLKPRHLAAISPMPGDTVYVSGYGFVYPSNRDAILGWLSGLSENILVIFDPGPLIADIPLYAMSLLIKRAHWITCNAREAACLTGESLPYNASAQLAAKASHHQVIVRDGPNGCILVLPGELPKRIDGFSVKALDTNGAGDTHTGAFVAALVRGAPPQEAARWANAAAALSVTRRGPATAPTREQVARWIGRDGG